MPKYAAVAAFEDGRFAPISVNEVQVREHMCWRGGGRVLRASALGAVLGRCWVMGGGRGVGRLLPDI